MVGRGARNSDGRRRGLEAHEDEFERIVELSNYPMLCAEGNKSLRFFLIVVELDKKYL